MSTASLGAKGMNVVNIQMMPSIADPRTRPFRLNLKLQT